MIDQGWFDKEIRDARDLELRQFTHETGIRVDVLPAPESAVEQIVLWKKLLANTRSCGRGHRCRPHLACAAC